MWFKKNNNQGVTLIELLLVVSLVSMLGLAVYQSLSNGLRVWSRSHQVVIEEDVAIFFQKIAHDLRNSYHYSLIAFQGDAYHFTFPSIIQIAPDPASTLPKNILIDQLGMVEYLFDPNKDVLYRQEANYSKALKNEFSSARILVENIEGIKFTYFYYTKQGEIESDVVLETPPNRVRIDVRFRELGGLRKMVYEIPILLES